MSKVSASPSGKKSTPKNKRASTPIKTTNASKAVSVIKGVEEAKSTQQVPLNFESLKFKHFQPQAVEAMAITADKRLVAVARENNSIEIWLRESWTQLLVIPGNKNCAIRNIHWLEKQSDSTRQKQRETNPLYTDSGEERRLITTSLSGVVIEWDLLSQGVRTKHTVNAAIWNSKLVDKNLYLACEDGSIKTLRVRKDSIELTRQFMRAETKCLSVEVTADQKFVYGGYADSSIRKWSTEDSHCELHFVKQTKKAAQAGKRLQDRSQQCLIWCLKLFGDDILFSGDSNGELTAWDTKHGTLVQTFGQLQADVTCIETNFESEVVYATGVDSRILTVQRKPQNGQWIYISLFRGQSNDIKSLIRSGTTELVSAGVNTDICVYKLN